MSYQKILLHAWKTTWRNKYLWFFGLFAVLLANNGGFGVVYELSSRNSGIGFFPGLMRYYETGVFSIRALGNLGKFIVSDPLSFIILLTVFLIFIVLGLFLLWLSIVSQASLVNNSALVLSGKSHSLKEGLNTGINKFLPVLGLNIILKILSSLIILLVTLPLVIGISYLSSFMASLLFLLLFLLFIPLIIAVSFIIKYAICYVVIKGQKIKEALYSALDLFRKNWIISLEMGFILFFINFLFGLLMVLAFLIVSIPILFIAIVFAKINFMFIFWAIMFAAVFLFFLAIIFSGAALTTFQISAWTGLFVQMIGKGMKSRVVNFFTKN